MTIDPNPLRDLVHAISEFERRLPGWWFTIGYCSVSTDASCGPDRNGPDADLLEAERHLPADQRVFDDGFHCDDSSADATCARSLRTVMNEALAARAHERGDLP